MFAEFKKFVLRGNVADMAVGIIIGAAFGSIVTSMVNDLLMPPIGVLLGGMDFRDFYWVLKPGHPAPPYLDLAEAQKAGAVLMKYGAFVNAVINFVIVAFCVFLLVRVLNRLSAPPAAPAAPATKDCPFCCTKVPLAAKRCPACTSNL